MAKTKKRAQQRAGVRRAPSLNEPLTAWDRTCLRVLVWSAALAAMDPLRRIDEDALCAAPWAGIGPRRTIEFEAALKSLHQRGLIARWDGAVSITARGVRHVKPTP